MTKVNIQVGILFFVFAFGVAAGIGAKEYQAHTEYVNALEDASYCTNIEGGTYNATTDECELDWSI